MASEASTEPGGTKSKQERIRDNQRRSRARRQEYLAGLERRVKECQVSCRDADLQRAAYADLQVENARLRDLLHYVGISPDVVENFGRHGVQALPNNAAALAARQIKPRYYQPNALRTGDMHDVDMTKQGSNCGPTVPAAPASLCTPTSAMPPESLQVCDSQQCPTFVATSGPPATGLPELASISPLSLYEWMHRPDSQDTPAYSPETFCCDAFGIPPNGRLLSESTDTVQCLVAKGMIEQYDPTPVEMEEIAARLATAFCPPRSGELGCRVNTQLLLQVLQEMDARPKCD
ncbi:uncharacterized protein Z520_08509 [Fonsecaea multimorphosa CBS 102226]|uniref:BZIP domain-containing protein n=1 Tax=Fonsecaea multimorphosa CBS 102226 TaxID=1442371 RepID=A0A0D2IFB1_9EURO|nr:uncharacterized protein Z520_08509 [Fonsecaea multimorphosa CBS 102226]KIX95801.1 hypothetical protein Z520_08509 [Fonsecaea multimorphosa CBS 102226]OAL21537.1 hypothetical protein AYO22_07933 [Fonsecaea multimorphosa]